jgi:TRAP-type C4-dicarboxylate transport system permease small subunit
VRTYPDTTGDDLLNIAWRDYQAWAEAARTLRRDTHRQTVTLLALLCFASFFGAVASLGWSTMAIEMVASLVATTLAAVATFLTRPVADDNAQSRWVLAQARADAIQSECYRYAARSGEYASREAALRFKDRLDTILSSPETQAIIFDLRAAEVGSQVPPVQMSGDWYRTERLARYRDWYGRRAARSGARAPWLHGVALTVGLLACMIGGIASAGFAGKAMPFFAALMTVVAAISAYSMVRRPLPGALSDAAIARQLDLLDLLHRDGRISDEELVSAGEDLLSSEHRARIDWIAQKNKQGQSGSARRSKPPAAR